MPETDDITSEKVTQMGTLLMHLKKLMLLFEGPAASAYDLFSKTARKNTTLKVLK